MTNLLFIELFQTKEKVEEYKISFSPTSTMMLRTIALTYKPLTTRISIILRMTSIETFQWIISTILTYRHYYHMPGTRFLRAIQSSLSLPLMAKTVNFN